MTLGPASKVLKLKLNVYESHFAQAIKQQNVRILSASRRVCGGNIHTSAGGLENYGESSIEPCGGKPRQRIGPCGIPFQPPGIQHRQPDRVGHG